TPWPQGDAARLADLPDLVSSALRLAHLGRRRYLLWVLRVVVHGETLLVDVLGRPLCACLFRWRVFGRCARGGARPLVVDREPREEVLDDLEHQRDHDTDDDRRDQLLTERTHGLSSDCAVALTLRRGRWPVRLRARRDHSTAVATPAEMISTASPMVATVWGALF